MTTIPSIACLGVIGKNNNPLHISIFPPHSPPYPTSSSTLQTHTPVHETLRTPLQYSLLLSSTLDIFDARNRTSTGNQNLTGDLGLLYAVDERLAAYGFETNTGVRFVVLYSKPCKQPTSASYKTPSTTQMNIVR
ncbi:fdb2781d-bf6d-4f06-966c-79baff7efdf9 [Sclerotinia trifoliorum]|uniref:Fdb2781d-bf6d-4f06-966c-79baff7efdf9 n=1 Tax=Sclerotinia trifoliorum TaxID=28548 RepID=A0A8H2W3H5_9HELO|nr:fdb2781d-bf6d-4f06-966c-79baff7efdf9 [Sclerotinia trifoliorum]